MNIRHALHTLLCDDLFHRNYAAAINRDKTVLRVILIGSALCFCMLFAAGFFANDYRPMRWIYAGIIVMYVLIYWGSHHVKDKAIPVLIYILHAMFMVFCTYNSAFIWSDAVCVMILAELLILPTLVLDKNRRILLVAVLSAAVYLTVISFRKAPEVFSDELVNVTCFTFLGCIVGTFTRHTQMQNFDNIAKLRVSREQYRLAMKHSGGIICEYIVAEKCVVMQKDVADVFDVGQKVYNVPYAPVKAGAITEESSEAYIKFYESIISGDETGTAEFCCKTTDGWRWQRASFSTIFSDDNSPVSAVISFVDITQQREKEALQKEHAEIDGLTGVLNRITTETTINRLLENHSGTCAFMILDLDDLKLINDTFGHPEGDKALQALAKCLKSNTNKGDIIGRVGGDEFVVFVNDIVTSDSAKQLAERLVCEISSIGLMESGETMLSSSIGVALCGSQNRTFSELYPLADKALYFAKRNGKKQYCLYSSITENNRA